MDSWFTSCGWAGGWTPPSSSSPHHHPLPQSCEVPKAMAPFPSEGHSLDSGVRQVWAGPWPCLCSLRDFRWLSNFSESHFDIYKMGRSILLAFVGMKWHNIWKTFSVVLNTFISQFSFLPLMQRNTVERSNKRELISNKNWHLCVPRRQMRERAQRS